MIYMIIEIIVPTLTKHLPMHPDRRNGIALRQSTFTAFAAAKAGERARQQFPKFVKAKGSDGFNKLMPLPKPIGNGVNSAPVTGLTNSIFTLLRKYFDEHIFTKLAATRPLFRNL
jgi:hypothetical protein